MFVDHSYQRECDMPRARKMAENWDPQLVGVLEVADRGDRHNPRYALVNGQHRWMAARLLNPDLYLPANVHAGLTVADEARLFDEIDRNTKSLTNWDRWHARKASRDTQVLEIERIVTECGLQITQNPGQTNIQCCGTLEKIWNRADDAVTLADTLVLARDAWGGLEGYLGASVLEGVSLVIDYNRPALDLKRLGYAMADTTPRQVRALATTRREEGHKGGLSIQIAAVLTALYNRRKGDGPKLAPVAPTATRRHAA